jgi:N-acetylglucosaminyl-diphospho-decaprenol L-rhamnosyltransferase
MDVSACATASPTIPDRLGAVAPRLSVVVVNYIRWDDTARLLRQLRRSSAFGDEAEVVVIDNHSPPHPIIPRLRRASGVSLRRFQSNRGFARAVNEGCRLAMGEWLLLLNPDTSVSPGFLDSVLDRADDLVAHDRRAGIVGFRLLNDDGSWQLSTGRFPTLASTLLGRLWPRCSRKYTPPPQPGRARVDWVTGCCLLVRRDCWRDLGGLDANFFLYYEDVDLCRRARARGWSVWYDPAVTITHHRPLHTRSVPPHLRLITRHALLTYARKHWPRWQADVMASVVRLEAWLSASEELGRIAADLQRGDEESARTRITRAVRHYEEGRSRAPVDRHSVVQSARPAGALPGQRPPARAVGS